MGAKVGGKKGSGMDEINVTPLIDVVLVLLIIFMVLTPMTVQKMAQNLPPIDDEEPPPPDPLVPPDQLLVAVYADGTVALNLKVEGDEELAKDLKRRLWSRPKKNVFVDAHPDANYGRVVQVIDMVRGASTETVDGKEKSVVHVGFADMKDEGPAKLEPGAVLPGTAVPGAVPVAPAVPG